MDEFFDRTKVEFCDRRIDSRESVLKPLDSQRSAATVTENIL